MVSAMVWLLSVIVPMTMSAQFRLQFQLEGQAERDRERMKVKRNNLTISEALKILSGNEKLMSLVQEHTDHHHVGHHLRKNAPGGAAAKAEKMLNEMIEEAMKKLDAERVRCSEFELKMQALMEESQQSIATFNAQSAKARGEIMDANAQIEMLSYSIESVEESIRVLLKKCKVEDAELRHTLSIIADDAEIMGMLAEKSACEGQDGAITPPKDFAGLLQCDDGDGASFIGFGRKVIREKVSQLKSESLRRGVQELLWEHGATAEIPVEYHGSLDSFVPNPYKMSFFQLDEDEEADQANSTQKPLSKEEKEKLAKKCAMNKNPNCKKINDKFLLMEAEVLETQETWVTKREKHQTDCDEQHFNFKSQLTKFQKRLKEQNTALAKATEAQNEADEQSRLENIELARLQAEYRKGMLECKTNIETNEAEECSLTKLRSEVFKSSFIVDCEVGSWEAAPCNKECGGGIQKLERKVSSHPVGGGAPCPALKMERSCNEHECPIDCVLGSWAPWTTCSADCDGGVRSRRRPIETDAAYGGDPCGETEQAEGCNAQACNQPCILGKWEPWSECSQECDGGFMYRHKPVEVAAVGKGACPAKDSDERVEYEECNPQPCEAPLLMNGVSTYVCDAKLDVILLLDGSGSLGPDGWEATKKAGVAIANAMEGGDANIQLAVELFSGPGTRSALNDCLGYTSRVPDMEKDCNVKWIQRLSPDTKKAAELIGKMEWPGRTTLTSAALSQASAELKFSRQDAESVVIVVTDGIPMSEMATYFAAYELRQKARLMFVPVTQHAPIMDIMTWVSDPIHENVIEVEDFDSLDQPSVLDKIIMNMCPNAH